MIKSAASPASNIGSLANTTVAALLEDLRSAHENLTAAMHALGDLTRGPLPDRDSFTGARWQISKASLRRRMLWGNIYAHLITRVGAEDAAALNDLQAADMQMLHRSAAHIGRWSRDAIEVDWQGYSEASRVIRGQMKACMDTEKRVLYPMLERLGRAAA